MGVWLRLARRPTDVSYCANYDLEDSAEAGGASLPQPSSVALNAWKETQRGS